jgi:hypothetical protein
MRWIPLSERLPKGKQIVVLFNPKWRDDPEFCGICVIASNPNYARINAIKHGYTHWARIPYPLPKKGRANR